MAAPSAVWKGFLSFGLVNVGVAAYKAADDPADATAKKMLHVTCKTPLNSQRVCTTCKVVDVPMTDVVSGVKQDDGSFVLVTSEEVAALKVASTQAIAVEAFVDADSIEPLYVDNTYYLAPSSDVSAPGMALLRDAMRAKGKVLTGRLCLYGRERAVAVRPLGRLLALQLLRSLDDLRSPEALPFYANLAAPVDSQQAALAGQLVDLYAGAFDPDAYEDQYVVAFQALVAAKKAGTPVPAPAVEPTGSPTADIMAALALSLAARVPVVKVPKADPQPVEKKPRAKKAKAA